MPARINIIGDKYHRLTVLSENGRDRQGRIMYDCQCTCGNMVNVLGASLRDGNTKSCGCLQLESATKHGMHGTTVYRKWRGILNRCLNPKHENYHLYCDVGISQKFIESFSSFYEEIGDPPTDEKVWTVDRIDPNLGYIEGNLRWATTHQQARNRRKSVLNKSGHTGVRKTVYPSGNYCWVASWYTLEGEQKFKYFSVKKLGDDVALSMAVSFREQKIAELNDNGADYSVYHGN